MLSRRIRLLAVMGFAVFTSVLLSAHDLPTNTMMNAFVKVEAHELHLVVRVPLDLLRGVAFPVTGGQYDLAAAGPAIQDALRALEDGFVLLENGTRLKASQASGTLRGPSRNSFSDYETALASVSRATDPTVGIGYGLGYLDAHFIYPISSPKSVFKMQTLVAADLGNMTKLTVRYMPLGESSRALMITGGSGPIALNPSWYAAGAGFTVLGVEHILSGFDHLLFLFCLIIPFRRIRALIPVITAFTVAHSITLLGSAYHLAPSGAWFPPFVETAIATSIVYMALENIVGGNLRRRWLITGLFGLVHGFGFSYALGQQLQFAGSHLLLSLFSFNVGIEVGQLLVLAVTLPALALFRRIVPERMGAIILSAIIAHTAWHWMTARWEVLRQQPWPQLDAAAIITLARWAAALLLGAGAAHLLVQWAQRRRPAPVKLPEPEMQRAARTGS